MLDIYKDSVFAIITITVFLGVFFNMLSSHIRITAVRRLSALNILLRNYNDEHRAKTYRINPSVHEQRFKTDQNNAFYASISALIFVFIHFCFATIGTFDPIYTPAIMLIASIFYFVACFFLIGNTFACLDYNQKNIDDDMQKLFDIKNVDSLPDLSAMAERASAKAHYTRLLNEIEQCNSK